MPADAADRPAGNEDIVTSPANVPGPQWQVGEGGLVREAEPYRAVSALAIAGFGVAALYAGLVGVGGLAAFYREFPRGLLVLAAAAPALAALGAALARVRQPRRLLAVAGLGLAGLLLTLGMGSVVAFSNRNPWLLPGWTIIFPIGAAVLCWVARVRIRESEGSLGGATLAGWGLGLSLVAGLLYGAGFQASMILAVRQQSNDAAREWIGLIQDGKLDQAFLKTQKSALTAGWPTEGPGLRRLLEGPLVNMPRGRGEPGNWSSFTHRDFVRLIQMGGPGAKIEQRKVDWTYEQGGYQVDLQYVITTDLVSFPLNVKVTGTESTQPDKPGRHWRVRLSGTSIPTGENEMRIEPASEEALALLSSVEFGRQFAGEWIRRLKGRQTAAAYLDTLPAHRQPDQKLPDRRSQELAYLLGAVPLLSAADPRRDEFRRGLAGFTAGGLVKVDEKNFWVRDDVRGLVIGGVKDAYDPASFQPPGYLLQHAPFPLMRRDGDRLVLRFDARTAVVDKSDPKTAKYIAEGYVVVEIAITPDGAPRLSGGAGPRIVAFELLRGLKASPRRGRGG
jgi:hypothetical protein